MSILFDCRLFIYLAVCLYLLSSFAASQKCSHPDESRGGCLVQVKSCSLYGEKLKFMVDGQEEKKAFYMLNVTDFSGTCLQSGENGTQSGSITLNFDKIERPLSITFQLHSSGEEGYWFAKSATVVDKKKPSVKYQFTSSEITASGGFSFSCNKLILTSSPSEKSKATLVLNRFQLQPFITNDTVFTESFDCSTWFTIPTWMGLISMSFFTFIVTVGIYFLFNIKSPDRFESAKSKPLTIATSD